MQVPSQVLATKTRLRVITWNLWWQFGPWKERAPAILATLRELDADIIALQEVWDDGTDNFARQLADALGYHYAYAPGARPNGVHMGNAILSRWPIANQATTPLYDQKNAEEMRVALYCQIDGPRGQIPVFCTHLNWQQHHSHIRQKQVADLAAFIKENRKGRFPPILCGDFNADPESDEIRMLTGQTAVPVANIVFHDAWRNAGDGSAGFTWDNENPYAVDTLEPNRRIDYIFVGFAGPNGEGHVTQCRLTGMEDIGGVRPSDHHAVLAELLH